MNKQEKTIKNGEYSKNINLHVAEPSFDTPAQIIEMMPEVLHKGFTHYSSTMGLESFRTSISSFYKKEFNVRIDPLKEIIPTNGAGEGLYLILASLFEPEDEIIIPNPTYHGFIKKVDHSYLTPVFVPMFEQDTVNFNFLAINNAITDKTKAIYICNPNNPTGTMLTNREMEQIVITLEKNPSINLIVDKCYSRILYDGAEYKEFLKYEKVRNQILVVDSFSKTFAMTGWRIGYIIGSELNLKRIMETAFDVRSSVNTAVQEVAARTINLDKSIVSTMVQEYSKRREIVLSFLKKHDIDFINPLGGFEVFADISRFGLSSLEFSERLKKTVNVEVVPGSEFGPHGEGYIRIVFCASEENLLEGLVRLNKFIEELKR